MTRLTSDQLVQRRRGLGGSDAPVVAGVSPYRKPFELYLEKIGELDTEAALSDEQRLRMDTGHRFEPLALDWYAERAGIQKGALRRPQRTIWDRDVPHRFVHPDALVQIAGKEPVLLEVKKGARRWDAVPQHVEAQVAHALGVLRYRRAVVLQITFEDLYEFPIERNDDLVDALFGLEDAFWQRVTNRMPPPMDGSAAASHYLDRFWQDGPAMVADADQRALLSRLLDVRDEADRLKAEDAELVNVLKQSMAGGMRLDARGIGSVLWTKPFDVHTVAWKQIAEGLLAGMTPEERDALVGIQTTVKKDVRQFRPTPAKNAQEAA